MIIKYKRFPTERPSSFFAYNFRFGGHCFSLPILLRNYRKHDYFPYPYEEKHAHFWLKWLKQFCEKDAYILLFVKRKFKINWCDWYSSRFVKSKSRNWILAREIFFFWNKGYVSETLQKLWNLVSKSYILIKFMLLIFRTILLRENFAEKRF